MLPNSVFDLASAPRASCAAKAQSRPDAQNQKPAQAFQPMLEAPSVMPARPLPRPHPSREAADAPAKVPQIRADEKPRADEPKPQPATSEQHDSQPEPCQVAQTKSESAVKLDTKTHKPSDAATVEGNAAGEPAALLFSSDAVQTTVLNIGSIASYMVSQEPAQVADGEQAYKPSEATVETPTGDGATTLPDAPIIPPMPIDLAIPTTAPLIPSLVGQGEVSITVSGALLQAYAAEAGEDAVLTGVVLEGEGGSGKVAPSSQTLAGGIDGVDDKPGADAALLKQAGDSPALLAHPSAFSGVLNKGADGVPDASGMAQDSSAELKPATQVNGTEKANSLVPQIGSRLAPVEQTGAERFADLADTPYGLRGLGDFHQTMDRLLQDSRLQTHGAVQQQHLRPTPLQMLPIEIGMQAMRGANSFQIRLDPAELGRVDVKLEVNTQGEVSAHLIVERPETLQMLRRDSTTLQYAFEQAGLKSSQDGLSFSLKGEGQNGQNQSQNGSNPGQKQEDDPLLKTQIEHLALRRVMIPHSSVDRVI